MSPQGESFDPAAADPRAFRDALGRFVTGVTIVTCNTPDGPLGITANSFASVSLDPPLVLWSPAKRSQRYPFFVAAAHFAIHVLRADQAPLCQAFARSGESFDAARWQPNAEGVPLIDGCLARFDCEKLAEHDGGDHTILIGRVRRVDTLPGEPLIFSGGRYGAFVPEP
ncbi:flavin reductase family protein [Salipiger sp. P9]|uniref:flavin reductase family protein n=1 Tax=Salipiger pentaromativorans TaxID=2943193 RepID=UPI0021574822|nr:flavin reductase family protein [Salipiger pentaromativorans]MCR8549395.1 flavin reductase family protein [Salipiger pentaromativorans]